MKAIITGITGQDGAYLAKFLLSKGYSVYGIKRPSSTKDYSRLKRLEILDSIDIISIDILNLLELQKLLLKIKPQEIYNLAAQSSVGLSFLNPIETIQHNILSISNLLESIRLNNLNTKLYQASSSEIFGQVSEEQLPITEKTLINPVSPYGISKASAHWIIKNYREIYGIFCCSGILFNHESALRKDHFVTKKIIKTAIDIKNKKTHKITLGNVDIKRDWGYAPDYVETMWIMLQQKNHPEDCIISSGKSHRLLDFAKMAFRKLDLDLENHLEIDSSLFRPNELEDTYGDNTKAKNILNWQYNKDLSCLVESIIEDELFFQSKGL